MDSVVVVLCDYLQQAFTLISFLLETWISQLHSAFYTTVSPLFLRVDAETTATERAWWDTRKGSAVVVWASGDDQSISQAIAISLASIRAKSGSRRAGRPPYTVIVILPSASWGLSSLISSWATRKARIESGKEGIIRGRVSHLNATSWYIFGLSNLSLRLGSPESSSSSSEPNSDEGKDEVINQLQRQQSDGNSSPGSRPPTPGKRRRLSFGHWSATDLVGYGKDMLKGLQIGQTGSSGIGAVIPVVADTSTLEGIHHAHSTIRAYCTSHDLLLRGLVVLPSVMSDNLSAQSVTMSRSTKIPVPSSSSSSNNEVTAASSPVEDRKHKPSLSSSRLHSARATLLTDVGEAMNIVASLAPALRSDGGRVVAIIPAAFRRTSSSSLIHDIKTTGRSDINDDDDDINFNVTRRAMLEMWSGLTKKLANDNILVSQIHMSSPSKDVSVTTKAAKIHHSTPIKEYRSLASRALSLARIVLNQAHFILYPVPCKAVPSRSHLDIYTSSEKEEEKDQEDTNTLCPPLLLEAVRNILVRSWPRGHYYIGIGPRLEVLWECIPGHNSLRDYIQSYL